MHKVPGAHNKKAVVLTGEREGRESAQPQQVREDSGPEHYQRVASSHGVQPAAGHAR